MERPGMAVKEGGMAAKERKGRKEKAASLFAFFGCFCGYFFQHSPCTEFLA